MLDLKHILLPWLLALCITFPLAFAVSEDLLWRNYHIHVTNDLPSEPHGEPSLYLHCKSKNKDLGEKSMVQHEDYTWDTKINLWRTTLFFCHAVWVNHKEQYFDAFKATRDEDRCMVYHFSCLWSVKEDGIYFSNDELTWTNAYPW
ncbi:hypothetical protein like AT3G24060 [Hibiscus trionum]|uniref:S-protein homolog n=1 Tax=Hibiscus trionum TaxID=183268 RepID=A0A9W7J5F4_HIBTR|nr:hypothetical protein like AT3G24060 [Hibiscus trionum]